MATSFEPYLHADDFGHLQWTTFENSVTLFMKSFFIYREFAYFNFMFSKSSAADFLNVGKGLWQLLEFYIK